jgi:hypothetical protein
MKKTAILTFILTLLAMPTFADDVCEVTKSTGDGAGTLPYSAFMCDDLITFKDTITTVTLKKTIYLNSGATLDGGDKVTIKSNGFKGALINISDDDATIKNITLDHKSTSSKATNCVKITGFANTVSNTTFKSCTTGVLVSGLSAGNKISQNTFVNLLAKPISIDGEANGGIKTPELFGGVYYNDASWKLYGGEAPKNATEIEIYKLSESDKTLSWVKTIDVTSDDVQINGSDFDLIMNWAETLPSDTLRLIVTDDANDTSEFSETIVASEVEDFLPAELAACAGSNWFWEVNFAGNSDGDDLINGAEDINHNCVVETSETNPESDDSDFDSVNDSEDNCPLESNNTQSDIDNDGVGNACEAVEAAKEGEDAAIDDYDGDGIEDATDNCPTLTNADQLDDDSNGTGNACEPAVKDEDEPDDAPLDPNLPPIPPPEPKPLKSDSGCTLIKESNDDANMWLFFMMILPLGISAFAGMTRRKRKGNYYGR